MDHKCWGSSVSYTHLDVYKRQAPRQVKGPDDDEDFLWTIEKKRFKQRRAEEAAQKEEEERLKRARERYATPEKPVEPQKPEDDQDKDKPADPTA